LKSDSTKLVKNIVSFDAWIEDLNLCEVSLKLTKNQYCASTGVAPCGGD